VIHPFDEFELDTDRFELRRHGQPVPVEPQVFALLSLLIENRHRLVPRSELIETIWAGRAVSETALSSRIKSARQALADDGVSQRYIRTVHGHGFRFVGRVRAPDDPSAADESQPRSALAWTSDVFARPVIAVLPFTNASGAAEDAWFTDGVAEDLIAELSSWRWFPILSRNSTFQRGRAGQSASARARALGARYAVTGRLLRAGSEARLAIELIDTETDTQLWSAQHRCGPSEIAGLQPRIAEAVFRQIAPALTSAETRRVLRRGAGDLSAWDMALKGLWHLHRATAQDFSRALELLEAATRADPGFALPWSLIALVRFELALKGWTGGAGLRIRDAFHEMLEAARTAVALDPQGWMGHALVSAGELWANGSFAKARVHADRAIELNPSGPMGHHLSGCIYGFAGQLGTAIEVQQGVYRVDPAYGHADVIEADLGLWHLLAGDLDRAAEHLSRSISLNPENVRAHQRLIALAGRRGDQALAREAMSALRARGAEPDEAYLAASYPFQEPSHAGIFRAALASAGLLGK
jgi:TolB-like protein